MFISLEGPEGAGKSSVCKGLAVTLAVLGRPIKLTREPGAGDFGSKVRELLLHGGELDKKSELFLFLADRSQHVATIIRPALASGSIVLCDRYTDSTVVYQGHARGQNVSYLKELNDFATDRLKPDLTLLIDIDPAVGLSRIENKDRLDSEPIEFHQQVREGFLKEAELEPERWVKINGEQPLDTVVRQCTEVVLSRLS